MLVITRRCDESLVIGDDIRVVVLGIADGRARLGIEAPKAVPVHRHEIYQRIERKTKAALVPLPVDILAAAERQAALAGITVEKYLSLVVGLGLAACNQT